MAKSNTPLDKIRIDKWLWAARFFKTRGLASEAVSGGKVQLNQQRARPSKEVKIGDRLHISKGIYTWDITILGLNAQRRPASEASLLYEEDEQSHKQRQEQVALQRDLNASTPHADRPTKKQRRQIHRFKQDW